MATVQETIAKKEYLLSRAKSAGNPVRVAELEAEIVELQRNQEPTTGVEGVWECLICERTFDLAGAIKANRRCPKCESNDTVRPTWESGMDIKLRPGEDPKARTKPRANPPIKTGKSHGPLGKPEKDRPKKPDIFIPCPCGCGQIPEGRGIFMPGHDGRIAGWIRKVNTGKAKGEDFGPEFVEIMRAWLKAGSPGGDHHPKIKDIVLGLRKGGKK